MTYSNALALEMLGLCEKAYAIEDDGAAQLPPGYTAPEPIFMDVSKRPLMLEFDPVQVWGYLTTLELNGSVVIVFRGTQTSGEWGSDLNALPMEFHCGYSVHRGFLGVYTAIRESLLRVMNGRKAFFIGHSLGAALATLAFLEFGGDLLTFAGPRVTEAVGAQALYTGPTVRVVNTADLVPNLPPEPMFKHGGREINVKGPGESWDKKERHSLENYRAGLGRAA